MIETWLISFTSAWKAKDLDSVLDLFSDDVEYWENPFTILCTKEEIRKEWSVIAKQKNIQLSTEVVLSQDYKYLVKWNLIYTKDEDISNWAGVYIISLNTTGKCHYFYQVGERKQGGVYEMEV